MTRKLEEAKRLYKTANADQRYVLEKLFPELAESEDERIRKEIINYFTEGKEFLSLCSFDREHILAWLEKQGEKDEEILILKDQIESLHAAIKAIKETHRIELKKQGEQKPTDKVEPIVVKDFNSVFSREHVEEIDKRIEKSQRLYNAKLRDAMQKVEDFPMTD